jgi:hypothetical protein
MTLTGPETGLLQFVKGHEIGPFQISKVSWDENEEDRKAVRSRYCVSGTNENPGRASERATITASKFIIGAIRVVPRRQQRFGKVGVVS